MIILQSLIPILTEPLLEFGTIDCVRVHSGCLYPFTCGESCTHVRPRELVTSTWTILVTLPGENTVKLGPALSEASKPHVSSRSFVAANRCTSSLKGNTHGNHRL